MIATGVVAALALGMLIARGSVSEAQTGYESPPSGGGAPPPPQPQPERQFRVRVFDANQSPQAETPVKTFAGLVQFGPAIAMDDNGNFVAAWNSRDTSSEQINVHSARFSAAGAQLGDNIIVPPSTGAGFGGRLASIRDPSVASDGSGNFVITYTDERFVADSPQFVVGASLYKSDGTRVKTFDVEAAQTANSSVARNGAGRFVVAYQVSTSSNSTDIRLNRYDAAGNLLGKADIATTPLPEVNPSVAIDTAGNSVVTWQVNQATSTKTDIRARKVTKDGALGGNVTVAATALEEQRPVVAMDRGDGDYVVAYEVVGKGVSVKELSNANAIRATHDLGPGIRDPAISMDGRGRYLVTYVPSSTDRGPAIFARYGVASIGPEIRVNAGEARVGGSAAANASAGNGRSVVVWTATAGTDIDSPLELKFEGQDVSVTGPLTCAAGNQWTINAVVTQGDSNAEGRSVGMCGGAVQEWRVRVAGPARGTFDPGAARVCARLSAKDPSGAETERRSWCADVELVSAAATAEAADDDDTLSIVALIVAALALLAGGAALMRSRRAA